MEQIKGFQGKYRFLSNFWHAPFIWGDIKWPTSEHAYQAAKTVDFEEQKRIRKTNSPGKAKRLGRKVSKREDWDSIKIDIMYQIVYNKFSQNSDLKQWLLNTKEAYIEETNSWDDTFWGVCNGAGNNNLGKILMSVRSELQDP